MIFIGDLSFAGHKRVKRLIAKRNEQGLHGIVKSLANMGVHYLYLSLMEMTKEDICWFINIIQDTAELPLCLETPSVGHLETALTLCRYGRPLINLTSLEDASAADNISVVRKYGARVIKMLILDNKLPVNANERLQAARVVLAELQAAGIEEKDIFLDPVIKPICTNTSTGREVFTAIRLIKDEFPQVNLISNVCSISFGLPKRELINKVFLVQLMAAGANAFIVDSMDKDSRSMYYISKMLLGYDPYCREYLTLYRRGEF